MIIKPFSEDSSVYVNCEYIKGYTFRDAAMGTKCALLPVICAGFALLGDKSAHFAVLDASRRIFA